jgi:hypothetical protein
MRVVTNLMLLPESCTQDVVLLFMRFVRNFCSLLLVFVFVELLNRLVNSKSEELVFYYAECKDTWVVPRDPTGSLCSGSRGSCPFMTRGLAALFYLFYFSNYLS